MRIQKAVVVAVMGCLAGLWGLAASPLWAAGLWVVQATDLSEGFEPEGADGTWARPFTRIAVALEAAAAGDTVAVLPGRYHESIVLEGKALHIVGLPAGPNELVVIDANGTGPAVVVRDVPDANVTIETVVLTGGRDPRGAVQVTRAGLELANCLLTGQRGPGAVVAVTDGCLGLRHCTVVDNAWTTPAAVMLEDATARLSHSVLWETHGTLLRDDPNSLLRVAYCDLPGGWPGAGNLAEDPLLTAAGAGFAFRLSAMSPCVDRGDPNGPGDGPWIDLKGGPRVRNGRVDLGCDESTPAEADPNEVVVFADTALEAAVREALGGVAVTRRRLAHLESLEAPGRGIRSLAGLEHAVSLRSLDLADNALTEIGPLAGLADLEVCSLAGNAVGDPGPLIGCRSLRYLDASNNAWDDVMVLGLLPALEWLDLGGNRIARVAALTVLPALQHLALDDNPLEAAVCAEDLPALRAQNPALELTHGACGPFTLTVQAQTGGRIVTPGAGTWEFPYGAEVRVRAEALPGYRFDGFTGDRAWPEPELTVTVTGQLVLTARFQSLGGLEIPDAGLRAALEEAIGHAPVTAADLETLVTLDASRRSIRNLAGLEHAVNLEELDLQRNRNIQDLSPLAGLTRMRVLDLNNNRIVTLAPLAGMTRLEWLDIHDNLITDISALAQATGLRTAILDRNRYSDITALAACTELRWLVLRDNLIEDISPLADLRHLTKLNLTMNPLNSAACDVVIPQILANNPGVDLAYHPCGPLTLTVISTDGGRVTSPGEGAFSYDFGERVLVWAQADAGYRFVRFSGNTNTSSNPATVTMKDDWAILAHFEPID